MKTRPTVEDILSAHADGLIQNQDTTDQLVREFESRWPEMALLLILARTLHNTLVLREAPRPLVNMLREELRDPSASRPITGRRRRWWVIGGVTSVVAAVAGAVAWRYLRSQPAGN